jgi:hypothetical protein
MGLDNILLIPGLGGLLDLLALCHLVVMRLTLVRPRLWLVVAVVERAATETMRRPHKEQTEALVFRPKLLA